MFVKVGSDFNQKVPQIKNPSLNGADFLFAEGVGFEPTVLFPVHSLSRTAV